MYAFMSTLSSIKCINEMKQNKTILYKTKLEYFSKRWHHHHCCFNCFKYFNQMWPYLYLGLLCYFKIMSKIASPMNGLMFSFVFGLKFVQSVELL